MSTIQTRRGGGQQSRGRSWFFWLLIFVGFVCIAAGFVLEYLTTECGLFGCSFACVKIALVVFILDAVSLLAFLSWQFRSGVRRPSQYGTSALIFRAFSENERHLNTICLGALTAATAVAGAAIFGVLVGGLVQPKNFPYDGIWLILWALLMYALVILAVRDALFMPPADPKFPSVAKQEAVRKVFNWFIWEVLSVAAFLAAYYLWP